jgi:hypothetical protein
MQTTRRLTSVIETCLLTEMCRQWRCNQNTTKVRLVRQRDGRQSGLPFSKIGILNPPITTSASTSFGGYCRRTYIFASRSSIGTKDKCCPSGVSSSPSLLIAPISMSRCTASSIAELDGGSRKRWRRPFVDDTTNLSGERRWITMSVYPPHYRQNDIGQSGEVRYIEFNIGGSRAEGLGVPRNRGPSVT